MSRIEFCLLCVLLLCDTSAHAAINLNGTWMAKLESQDGKHERFSRWHTPNSGGVHTMIQAYGLDIPRTLEDLCDPRRMALLVYDMQVGVCSK